jgi:hypothetical protein
VPDRRAGLAAATAWLAVCLVWFDPSGERGAPARRMVLAALLFAAFVVALGLWIRRAWPVLRGDGAPGPRHAGTLAVVLALLFRLPLAWQGAAGYVTADGALSGIVALDVRDGRAHHVFVPQVPYSGSLKSHLTAPLAAVVDPARAFALASLGFYLIFVAALVALARRAGAGPFVPVGAGLYAAFAPAFVTRYSLSNDGNYVEVLALGTTALLLAARWAREAASRETLALLAGVSLGLAFWSHILAVIPLCAVVAFMVLAERGRAVRSVAALALGFALGDAPGLLWNAVHGGDSFRYLLPGSGGDGAGTVPAGLRLVSDHLPVLLGYDFGYAGTTDALLRVLGWASVAAAVVGTAGLVRDARSADAAGARVLLLFTAVNVVVAGLFLPYIPGNARYLLFLVAPVAVFVARALRSGPARLVLVLLVAGNAGASLAQGLGTIESDGRWRALVAGLRQAGVRWCYSDFFLATRINFLSDGDVTCSSKLGPTTTEYFFRFREEVDAAPAAAFVPATSAAADKIARRLERMGVGYDRRDDLLKPVLAPRGRKVGPEDLFPDREFPLR